VVEKVGVSLEEANGGRVMTACFDGVSGGAVFCYLLLCGMEQSTVWV